MIVEFQNEADKRGVGILIRMLEEGGGIRQGSWERRNNLKWAERRGFVVQEADEPWYWLTPKGRKAAELYKELLDGERNG